MKQNRRSQQVLPEMQVEDEGEFDESGPLAEGGQATNGPPWRAKTNLGYAVDVAISALQKAIRRGREREALFWAHELYTSGRHGYFWRRMMIIAHEEIASDLAACQFIGQCRSDAIFASRDSKGRIEGLIEAHAVIVACRAVKSREACDAAVSVDQAKKAGWRIQPHDAALDKHTGQGRSLGRDRQHFADHGRLVAGELGRNDYEEINWGKRQPRLRRPEEKGAEPDVTIPKVPRLGTV